MSGSETAAVKALVAHVQQAIDAIEHNRTHHPDPEGEPPGAYRWYDEAKVLIRAIENAARPRSEDIARARLNAAAPELLEALRELANDLADRFDMDSPSTNPGMRSAVTAAHTAIAKATGAPA